MIVYIKFVNCCSIYIGPLSCLCTFSALLVALPKLAQQKYLYKEASSVIDTEAQSEVSVSLRVQVML